MGMLTGKKSIKQTQQQVYSKDALYKQNTPKTKGAESAQTTTNTQLPNKDIER